MICARFVVDYPKRCLDLIKAMEPTARQRELVGSFSLLVAASVFVIPYERMRSNHPLHKATRDVDLFSALKSLKKTPFVTAPFWDGNSPKAWRFSRIMTNANDTTGWKDKDGHHPMGADAKNSLQVRTADEVLQVIRNALAHGNIVYLNESGFEQRDTKLQFLGFLSRYEETPAQRAALETYRLVTTTEDEFLHFVKVWAKWVSRFRGDNRLSEGRMTALIVSTRSPPPALVALLLGTSSRQFFESLSWFEATREPGAGRAGWSSVVILLRSRRRSK